MATREPEEGCEFICINSMLSCAFQILLKVIYWKTPCFPCFDFHKFPRFPCFHGEYSYNFSVPCKHGKHGNIPMKTTECPAPWFSKESMDFSHEFSMAFPWFFHGFPMLSVPGLHLFIIGECWLLLRVIF